MNNKVLNIKYASASAAYLMLLCATMGYTYNFLSQCGYPDGQVGLTITVISILGILGQTYFGSFIDKSKTLDERSFIIITMFISIISSLLLFFIPTTGILPILISVIGFTSASIGTPFLNSMAFIYEKEGFTINYGLGRGVGSAAYAVGSAILGKVWALFGTVSFPIYIVVTSALTLATIYLMPKAHKETTVEKETSSISYLQFFSKYKAIILPFIAMVCIYFCHMLINTYIAKIIMYILGDSTSSVEGIQGTAMFIQAMVELPTMFLFGWLINKFGIHKLLVFSAIAFAIKHIATILCPNITIFYGICVLQMFAYAILCPGGVYLANEIVAPEDRNKGQAIIGITATAGNLLASFIGGQLFQITSTYTVFLIGTILSCIGSVLLIISILSLKKKD